MLTSLLIFLGISGVCVKLLDFYMSDGQKKWLNDRMMQTWNCLDEAKRVAVLDILRSKRVQRILGSVFAVIAVIAILLPILLLWGDPDFTPDSWVWEAIDDVTLLVVSVLMIWLGIKILYAILRGRTALQTFVRMSLTLIIACSPLILIVAIIVSVGPLTRIDNQSVAVLLFFALCISVVITEILLIFWLATAVVVLIIYSGSLLLYMIELSARRIAEYPKGPVLAAGTLMGMIGALIKAFEAR